MRILVPVRALSANASGQVGVAVNEEEPRIHEDIDAVLRVVDQPIPEVRGNCTSMGVKANELGVACRAGASVIDNRWPEVPLFSANESCSSDTMPPMRDSLSGNPTSNRFRVNIQLFSERTERVPRHSELAAEPLVRHCASPDVGDV